MRAASLRPRYIHAPFQEILPIYPTTYHLLRRLPPSLPVAILLKPLSPDPQTYVYPTPNRSQSPQCPEEHRPQNARRSRRRRLNALKHGLTAEQAVIRGEKAPDFKKLLESLMVTSRSAAGGEESRGWGPRELLQGAVERALDPGFVARPSRAHSRLPKRRAARCTDPQL